MLELPDKLHFSLIATAECIKIVLVLNEMVLVLVENLDFFRNKFFQPTTTCALLGSNCCFGEKEK
jgi:hypothetical protein